MYSGPELPSESNEVALPPTWYSAQADVPLINLFTSAVIISDLNVIVSPLNNLCAVLVSLISLVSSAIRVIAYFLNFLISKPPNMVFPWALSTFKVIGFDIDVVPVRPTYSLQNAVVMAVVNAIVNSKGPVTVIVNVWPDVVSASSLIRTLSLVVNPCCFKQVTTPVSATEHWFKVLSLSDHPILVSVPPVSLAKLKPFLIGRLAKGSFA